MKAKREELTDKVVGMIIMTLLLIPQIWHTHYVFEANNRADEYLIAWCYAIGIDTAILYFTWKGWIRVAFAYLFVTLSHNVAYYYAPKSLGSIGLLCISGSITLFVAGHLYLHRRKETDITLTGLAVLPEKVSQINKAIQAGVHLEAQPFVCPECGETFPNNKGLNGHVSSHKKHHQWNPEHYGDWELENYKRHQILQ